jgi:hypothetical protein
VKKHFKHTFSPASCSWCIFKNSDSRRPLTLPCLQDTHYFGKKIMRFSCRHLLTRSLSSLMFPEPHSPAQEHIYSANTQVDTYLCTMLDGKSAQSESSESADGSDSEPSQQDFDASVLGSIASSDASHLGSISCSLSVSDEFSETSEVARRVEEVLEWCDNTLEFTDKSDVSTPENTKLNSSNLDEGEEVQSIPSDRSIAHHAINNNLCQFLSIDIETGGGCSWNYSAIC